jgi:ArsR family transcriptional regulator, arsenate/arsenite/antimonite-responsive transcriptional repressor
MKPTPSTKSHAAVDELERVCKALADKTRLRILGLLGNDEVCVCHIHDSLGLPQPTVSRHLAYLRRSGVVAARRDGIWMHYRISRSLEPLARDIVGSAIDALKRTPDTAQDRKQFQKSFGQLYVLDSTSGGSCCSPRAPLAVARSAAHSPDGRRSR